MKIQGQMCDIAILWQAQIKAMGQIKARGRLAILQYYHVVCHARQHDKKSAGLGGGWALSSDHARE